MTIVYLFTYLLALVSALLINKALAEVFFLLIIIFAMTIGFLGSWAGIYERYIKMRFVGWFRNILVIAAVASVFPVAPDAEFIKRCFIALVLLNSLQSFCIFTTRDMAVSQIISAVIIILAPPFLLQGGFNFILLITAASLLTGFILNFFMRNKLSGKCEKTIITDKANQAFFSIVSPSLLTVFFTAITMVPIFFILARFQFPVIVLSPYHLTDNSIDYFINKSSLSVESPLSVNKYSLESGEKTKGWLVVPGKTNKFFLHGMLPGKIQFGDIGAQVGNTGEQAYADKTAAINRQERFENTLSEVVNFSGFTGKILIIGLVVIILCSFLFDAVKIYVKNNILFKKLSVTNPKSFIIKTYFSLCQAMSLYYPRAHYMTSEEYLNVIKNNISEIGDSFEIYTSCFQEAIYSNHALNVSESAELYPIYKSAFNYLWLKAFTWGYISQRLRNKFLTK